MEKVNDGDGQDQLGEAMTAQDDDAGDETGGGPGDGADGDRSRFNMPISANW